MRTQYTHSTFVGCEALQKGASLKREQMLFFSKKERTSVRNLKFSLNHWFSKYSAKQNDLEGMFKRIAGPPPEFLSLEDQRICISNSLQVMLRLPV